MLPLALALDYRSEPPRMHGSRLKSREQLMTLDGDSLMLPLPELVQKLSSIIGKKLTAFVIAAKDTRAVDRLIEGELLSSDSEQRLRCAYQVATILSAYDSPHIAQAWLMGLNPELGDRVPIRLIREDNLEQLAPLILEAAGQYILGS